MAIGNHPKFQLKSPIWYKKETHWPKNTIKTYRTLLINSTGAWKLDCYFFQYGCRRPYRICIHDYIYLALSYLQHIQWYLNLIDVKESFTKTSIFNRISRKTNMATGGHLEYELKFKIWHQIWTHWPLITPLSCVTLIHSPK